MEDFKRNAVTLVTEQGYKSFETARSLGIGVNLTMRRKREFEQEASGAWLSIDELDELQQLRMEKEIKKGSAYFAKEMM
jgi:transposase